MSGSSPERCGWLGFRAGHASPLPCELPVGDPRGCPARSSLPHATPRRATAADEGRGSAVGDRPLIHTIVSCFDITKPDPKVNGLYMQCADTYGYGLQAKQMADWIINDSDGKANVMMVNIEDYPILQAERKAIQTEFKEKCPDCKFDLLPVTVDDVGGGKVPSKVAAYLQSHPDVTYVHLGVGGHVATPCSPPRTPPSCSTRWSASSVAVQAPAASNAARTRSGGTFAGSPRNAVAAATYLSIAFAAAARTNGARRCVAPTTCTG